MFSNSHSGSVPEECIIAQICENFGWTYQQYLAQPQWFLDVIYDKMNIEGEHQKKELDKIKNKKYK